MDKLSELQAEVDALTVTLVGVVTLLEEGYPDLKVTLSAFLSGMAERSADHRSAEALRVMSENLED